MPNSNGGPCAPPSPPCSNPLVPAWHRGCEGSAASQHPGMAVGALGGVVGTMASCGDLMLPEGQDQGVERDMKEPRPKEHLSPPQLQPGLHPCEKPPGSAGQGEAPEDSQVPTEPQRGCCHHQSPTLGSQAGRWWEGTPSSPSHKPPQPAERVPLPPRGASHQGGRGSHPAGCQHPVKPPSSHPVKPVSNWGGVTTSCSVRSTAKPDHTVSTPKRQGRAQSLLR